VNRKIVLGIFVLVVIVFLLPWINVSCMGTSVVTANGFDMVTGKSNDVPGGLLTRVDNKMDPQPLAILILVSAIVGIIITLLKWKRAPTAQTITAILGIVFLIALKLKLDNQVTQEGQGAIKIDYLIGYWLAIVLFAAVAVMSFLKQGISIKITKTPHAIEPDMDKKDNLPPGI
jgi:hypothetical protein